MFQIAAARIALQRFKDPRGRQFAAAMLRANQASAARLKVALTGSSPALAPPAILPDDKQDRIEQLTTVPAAEFGRPYMDAQVTAQPFKPSRGSSVPGRSSTSLPERAGSGFPSPGKPLKAAS